MAISTGLTFWFKALVLLFSKGVNNLEQPDFHNKPRPKSPFATMDGLPKEVKTVQKMLKDIMKNQKEHSKKLQNNNEAFVILDKQIQELITETQKINYYLSLLVTMQQYIVDNNDLDDDAQILRETVDEEFRKRSDVHAL